MLNASLGFRPGSPLYTTLPRDRRAVMRNTFFDASAYAAGLNPTYDATVTHFTFLDDGEIKGGGLWMAQPGENLHVTIQNTAHTVVAHYFYHRVSKVWRYHGTGTAPVPYGTHIHDNLKELQKRAIDFAWPPMAHFVTKPDKQAKKKKAEAAKRTGQKKEMDDVLSDKTPSRVVQLGDLKPVRFPMPPGGRISEIYIGKLIAENDVESLAYVFRSKDWPLEKWDSAAWTKFLDWMTST
jgi:hypothetical protein